MLSAAAITRRLTPEFIPSDVAEGLPLLRGGCLVRESKQLSISGSQTVSAVMTISRHFITNGLF